MAVHSVPQNVEAEDQVIGFLSLKQLIFTIIAIGFCYLTYFFFVNVHPLAAIIWLPFDLFFLVMGLYRRKDQPADVFLASAIGFYLKPKVRIWSQDGYEERVVITAPPIVEKQYTKNFTGEEAMGRLSRLSLMMDSRGWESKRATDWQNQDLVESAESSRIVDKQEVAQAQGTDAETYTQPPDQYDENSRVGQEFEQRIQKSTEAVREDALRQTARAAQADAEDHPRRSAPAPSPTTTAEEERQAAALIASRRQEVASTVHEKVIVPPSESHHEEAPMNNRQPSIADSVLPELPPEILGQEANVPPETPQVAPPADVPSPARNDIGVARETDDGSVEISLH
jgi:hypothetical protein